MKLIDYSHNDQLYFIESFLDYCKKVSQKSSNSKQTNSSVNVNTFLLSQIVKK